MQHAHVFAVLQRPAEHRRAVDAHADGQRVVGYVGENGVKPEPVDDVADDASFGAELDRRAFSGEHILVLEYK